VKIEADPTQGPVPLEVSFRAEVEGQEGQYSYSWDFGDGGTSTEKNPKYTYTSPGNYTVKLEVENQCGRKRTATTTINAYGFEGTISKRFLKTEASPTEEVPMEIKIFNDSEYDFKDVRVWDELSPYLQYEGDDAPVKPKIEGQKITWNFPRIGKGERIKFTVKLRVRKDAPEGRILNWAYLDHSSLQNPIKSNKAVLKIKIPKISVKKSVDKGVAKPGDEISYTLRIENPSNVDVEGLTIQDSLPSPLEFLSQESSLKFTRSGNRLRWEGVLRKGSSEVIRVRARIKETTLSGTVIRNQAKARAELLPQEVKSNTVITRITSNPISTSQILFRKKSEIPQADVGKIIRFRIVVWNRSSSPLLNPRIDDYLPQGFNYVKGTTLYNGKKFKDPRGKRNITWELPLIKPGETAVLRYQVIIGTDAKRGKNINRALLKVMDNSGKTLNLEAQAFVNVSSSGFIFYSGIEGFVYLDRNKDGILDPSDTPLKNIEVRLSSGEKIYTDFAGHFSFEGLYPGEYAVGVNTATLPENFKPISPSPVPVVLSDGLTTYVEFRFALEREEEVGKSSLEGFVFFDKNSNGNFDKGEPPVENFRAVLDGRLITQGKMGRFKFSHLDPGHHLLEIEYGDKVKRLEVDLIKGPNKIEVPLKYSGITVIIRGEK